TVSASRGFCALRLRALASLLLALERRRIAHPKAQDYADFQRGITAGICGRRNGFQTLFCAAAILSLVAASTMTVLLTVSSRAFSIQQTCGRRCDQVWSQWSRVPRRGRSGLPRMR